MRHSNGKPTCGTSQEVLSEAPTANNDCYSIQLLPCWITQIVMIFFRCYGCAMRIYNYDQSFFQMASTVLMVNQMCEAIGTGGHYFGNSNGGQSEVTIGTPCRRMITNITAEIAVAPLNPRTRTAHAPLVRLRLIISTMIALWSSFACSFAASTLGGRARQTQPPRTPTS